MMLLYTEMCNKLRQQSLASDTCSGRIVCIVGRCHFGKSVTLSNSAGYNIEVLFVKVTVFILLLFATLLVPECSQNQTAVSDTLRSLSDF